MEPKDVVIRMMKYARPFFERSQYYMDFQTYKFGIPDVPLHRLTLGDLMIIRQTLETAISTYDDRVFLLCEEIDCWAELMADILTDFYLSNYSGTVNSQYYTSS